MTASVSNWCRGSPCSTSASASISPAQCAMLVASNGISAGNGGWGYECPQHRSLLVTMGPDRRQPLKLPCWAWIAPDTLARSGHRSPDLGGNHGFDQKQSQQLGRCPD